MWLSHLSLMPIDTTRRASGLLEGQYSAHLIDQGPNPHLGVRNVGAGDEIGTMTIPSFSSGRQQQFGAHSDSGPSDDYGGDTPWGCRGRTFNEIVVLSGNPARRNGLDLCGQRLLFESPSRCFSLLFFWKDSKSS